MEKKVLFGLTIITIIFLAYLVHSAIFDSNVEPITANESTLTFFNFTINNTDSTENITTLEIIIPQEFSYEADSANSSVENINVSYSNFTIMWENKTNESEYILKNGTAGYFWFNATTATFGNYSFNISTTDNSGDIITALVNITVNDSTPPTIFLNIPSNNTWSKILLTNFNCSATDTSELSKIELTIWNVGVLQATNYSNVTGTENSSAWTHNLTANKVYFWNCNATDNLGQSSWTENRTLTIDTTLPIITSTGVSEGAEYDEDDFIDCNCTASDNLDSQITCSTISGCNTGSGGNKTAIFRAEDQAGNRKEAHINYTVYAEEEEEATGGGTTPTSESGGGSEPVLSDVGATSEEHCWDAVSSGAIAEFNVNSTKIGVIKITFIPNTALTNPCLEAKQVISATAAGVVLYSNSDNVYKYFKIIPSGISDTQLTTVLIEFSVSKTWVYNHKKETVALNRYYNGWNKLDTEQISEDTDFIYYSAESPGFSSFVITADKISVETSNLSESCGNAACEINENSTNCCQDCGCEENFECRNNKCEKKSTFFLTGWFSNIGEKIHIEWLSDSWLFGWPIWSFIVIGALAIFIVLAAIFRKKFHLSLPFEIDFAVHKKPNYGFR